jgi:N utilization substance protein B
MLSRHILRIKAFQNLYAYFMQEDMTLDKGKKMLFSSLNKIHELIIHQLDSFLQFMDFYIFMLEENKKKLLPTAEDLNPNLKLAHNPFIIHLQNNHKLQKEIASYPLTWDRDIFRKIYLEVIAWKPYQNYMKSDDDTFPYHRDFACKLFKKKIAFSDHIKDFLETIHVGWNFDINYTGIVIYGWLKDYDPSKPETTVLPPVLKPSFSIGDISDEEFIVTLFEKTILHHKEYENILSQIIENWDLNRITYVDQLILKMAMTEFLYLPTVPVKVTIDEYLHISDTFGTEKSKIFINGILDKCVNILSAEHKIKKYGAGLAN